MTANRKGTVTDPSSGRITKQRLAIVEALGAGDFRSAQGWHDLLRSDFPRIGLATVYRTLQALVDSGDVDTVVTESGETLYRLCESPQAHHHHIRCRECGAAKDVDLPQFEAFSLEVGRAHGFASVDHTVEITGICPDCQAASK